MTGAKILLGVACLFSLTASGLATWAVQDPGANILTRQTWMPLGLAAAVFLFGLGAIWRAFHYLNERDSRMDGLDRRIQTMVERQDRFSDRQDRLTALLVGTEDPATGVRSGGLMEDVHATRDEVSEIKAMLGNGKAE